MAEKTPHSDNELLAGMAAGNEKAMEVLFQTHNLALMNFAIHISRDRAQAEDAVTDAFIQLWDRKTSFNSIAAVKSFLYQCTRNACINWLQHQAVVFKSQPELAAKLKWEESDYENQELNAELIQFLYQEIIRLPKQYSEIITLIFIDDLSHEEAAQKLGITEANLRMRKSRALEQLRIRMVEKGLLLLFLKFTVAKSCLACLYD